MNLLFDFSLVYVSWAEWAQTNNSLPPKITSFKRQDGDSRRIYALFS